MNEQNNMHTIGNKVLPLAMKFSEIKIVKAIRDAFNTLSPLIIIGSLFLFLIYLPKSFSFINVNNTWANNLNYVVNATFGIIGLLFAVVIPYFYARSYKIEPITPIITNISAYILAIPITKSGKITLLQFGSVGILAAILLSFLTIQVFKFFQEKHLSVKVAHNIPPNVINLFLDLIPIMVVLIIILLLKLLIESFHMISLIHFTNIFLSIPLKNISGNYFGGLIYVLMVHFLWSIGIHGGNIVNSIMSPIFLQQLDENRIAFQAGKAIPNIISDSFWVFVHIGGSGMVLALAIVILFKSKSSKNKKLGKLGIGPTIFSINEPIMFGLPVILNPIILIPYILSVVVAFSISYTAMYFGIVPRTNGIMIHWTVPIFISGYLATGSIKGALLQLVN